MSAQWLGPVALAQPEAPAAAPPETAPAVPVAVAEAAPLESAAAEPAVPTSSVELRDTTANTALVASSVQQFGRNSLPTAEAYVDLAAAERQAGNHEAAAESYLAAVEIYRAIDGPFTPLAIAPLTSLGDNYREGGDPLRAVSSYGEARTVSRRANGLLNPGQVELLDKLSEALLDLNEHVEADRQQLEALRLVNRSWPPESDEALAGRYKYAAWLHNRNQYQLEREQYLTAMRIIRQHYGKDDRRQVTPLLGIGNSYRHQRLPDSQGLASLRDAHDLLLLAPERDPLALATVMRDIGDWEAAFERVAYDGNEYLEAWALLGEVPNGDALRTEWFVGPNYVIREPISTRDISEEADAPTGSVTVRFDLDRSGQATNLAIVESNPPGLKDEAVMRHIRRSRFRPQIADGQLTVGRNLALMFEFQYLPGAVAATADAAND